MDSKAEYPDFVARFYDPVYSKLRDDTDKQYFLNKINDVNGSILEIGVGTGRFFISALNAGADIYGVDFSKSMLDVLKKKLPVEHHNRIYHQDARNLKLDKKFDLILAPFRVFSHLIETNDQLNVLNKVSDHLNKNGVFIFDLFIPDYKIISEGITERTDFDGEFENGKSLKRIVSVKPDVINQVNYVTMEFVWQENGNIVNKKWEFPMRYYFRYELIHLVERSKLNLVNMFGDYNENELSNKSKDFILICRRK